MPTSDKQLLAALERRVRSLEAGNIPGPRLLLNCGNTHNVVDIIMNTGAGDETLMPRLRWDGNRLRLLSDMNGSADTETWIYNTPDSPIVVNGTLSGTSFQFLRNSVALACLPGTVVLNVNGATWMHSHTIGSRDTGTHFYTTAASDLSTITTFEAPGTVAPRFVMGRIS